MSTATLDPPAAEVAPPDTRTAVERLMHIADALRPGQRVTVDPVPWEEYEGLMAARDEAGRHFRLTYDQGRLEIMPTSLAHELFKKIIALLIEVWVEETGGDYRPGGEVTVKSKPNKQGFEPDECFYIQNWERMAGRRELDLAVDPPPDLIVEAEVSRTAIGRLPVFAALHVPEVWRFDGTNVVVLLLGDDGTYVESAISRAIPAFPFADAARFVAMADASGFVKIRRTFRDWIRSLPSA